MSIYSDDPLRAEPDPNPIPRLVLFGPWGGPQQPVPPTAPVTLQICTICGGAQASTLYISTLGKRTLACADCRTFSQIAQRNAATQRRRATQPDPKTRYCTRCRHWVAMALFDGVDRHGQPTQFVTCSPCRVHHSAYNVAKRAAVAVGGTSDGR